MDKFPQQNRKAPFHLRVQHLLWFQHMTSRIWKISDTHTQVNKHPCPIANKMLLVAVLFEHQTLCILCLHLHHSYSSWNMSVECLCTQYSPVWWRYLKPKGVPHEHVNRRYRTATRKFMTIFRLMFFSHSRWKEHIGCQRFQVYTKCWIFEMTYYPIQWEVPILKIEQHSLLAVIPSKKKKNQIE